MEEFMLQGWKDCIGLLRQMGVIISLRTLKEWHYQRKPIPFEKTWPSPYARIEIPKSEFIAWYKEVKTLPRLAR